MVVDRSWKPDEGYRVLRSYQGSRQRCIKARVARIWELDFRYAQGPQRPTAGNHSSAPCSMIHSGFVQNANFQIKTL